MKRQIIIAVAVTFIIAGLLGFYAGRFIEQKNMRKSFSSKNGVSQQQRQLPSNPQQR